MYRTNERIFAIMHHICRYSSFYTISSTGTVKRQMDEVGRDLRELRVAVSGLTAHLRSESAHREGSVFTTYSEDNKAVWRKLPRVFAKDGLKRLGVNKA